ncbi:hypothetical protein KCG48_10555 [Proteiniclasticum sp. BAD-10]|uniref:Uncharacterized protein n=1 Tax=Proteiniclasticum sediminis TaxID=2804028 RepID=A0A941CS52_9CLOT|nr:hypothetical protein [Proteiniclasticum sediminis]MBR0576773.1 hypothetical protein [Proteiniclasticum sediminis]
MIRENSIKKRAQMDPIDQLRLHLIEQLEEKEKVRSSWKNTKKFSRKRKVK